MKYARGRAFAVLMAGPVSAAILLFACASDPSPNPLGFPPSSPDTGAPETSYDAKLGTVTISIVGNGEVKGLTDIFQQFMDCTGTDGVKSGSCIANAPNGYGSGTKKFQFTVKPAQGWVIQDTGYEYGDNPIHDTGAASTFLCQDSVNLTIFVTFVAVEAGTDAAREAAPSNASISVSSANALFPTQTITSVSCGDTYAYIDVPAAVTSALALPAETYLGFFEVDTNVIGSYIKSGTTTYYDGRTAGAYNSGTIPPVALTNSAGGAATVTDTINVSGTFMPCP